MPSLVRIEKDFPGKIEEACVHHFLQFKIPYTEREVVKTVNQNQLVRLFVLCMKRQLKHYAAVSTVHPCNIKHFGSHIMHGLSRTQECTISSNFLMCQTFATSQFSFIGDEMRRYSGARCAGAKCSFAFSIIQNLSIANCQKVAIAHSYYDGTTACVDNIERIIYTCSAT